MNDLIELLKGLIKDLELSKIDNIHDRLNQIWEILYINKIFDPNYLLSYNNIANKNIDDLTNNEVVSLITYMFRQERFYDGFSTEYLNSERFIDLLNKFVVILENNRRHL